MKALIFKLATLLIFLTVSLSYAGVEDQINFKNSIELQVGDIVKQYDPIAIVSVKVNYKTISTRLPGLDLGAEHQSFATNEISSFVVDLKTATGTAPDWVKDLIKSRLNGANIAITINVSQVDEDTLNKRRALVEQNSPQTKLAYNLLNALDSGTIQKNLFSILLISGIFLAIFGISLVLLYNQLFKRNLFKISEQFSKTMSATSNASKSSKSDESEALPSRSEHAFHKKEDSVSSNVDLNSYEKDGLISLLSDCYWCEMDSYAAWIWQHINAPKKKEVISHWQLPTKYFEFIQGCEPLGAYNFHTHPHYLNPSMWNLTSQKDLQKALSANPSLWHHLGPMRKAKFSVSIQERIRCIKSIWVETDKVLVFAKKSEHRKLAIGAQISSLSYSDEAEVVKNPDMIPKHMRPSFPSLVWLALSPIEHRVKVLGEINARDLAEAWDACPDVLACLEEAIPEKKLNLLRSYGQKIKGSSKSAVWTHLFKSGLEIENELHVESPEKKAA